MRTRTLLELRTGARQLADCVNDANIPDAMATDWVNDEIADLWEEVFAADPDRFVAMVTIATTSGTRAYDVPDDFMSIRRIDWLNGGTRIPIEPAPLLEMDTSTDVGGTSPGRVVYRVMGGGLDGSTAQLYLFPDPGTSTYEMWYVTAPALLSGDTDVYDGVAGWERFVMYGVASKMLERQERDSTPFRMEKERARKSIQTMARRRDSGRAKRITDVRSQRGSWRDLPDP